MNIKFMAKGSEKTPMKKKNVFFVKKRHRKNSLRERERAHKM